MDRIIEIKVNGSHLTKDSRIAGVQHEGNAKTLRIEFDEGWDGYAKKVTFWDATGSNPVERTLTADLLEDITESIRIYLCKIPPEPMAEAGEFTFVIDGYIEGVRQRSIADTLVVKAAPFIEQADEPTDPTPSQAEQLQVQIDTLLGDIQKEAIRAEDAADRAEDAREGAEEAQQAAGTAADRAEQAQAAVENMTVSSETLAAGSPASVKKTTKDGVVNLHFGIPKGAKGESGTGGSGGSGDMSADTYDPTGKAQDIFAYADKAAADAAGKVAEEAGKAAADAVADNVEEIVNAAVGETVEAAAKEAAREVVDEAVAAAPVKSHNHANDSLKPNSIEFYGANSEGNVHGGYLDFHYGQSTEDYTTRLIENQHGVLSLQFNGDRTHYRLYHEGYKPTAAGVGAFPNYVESDAVFSGDCDALTDGVWRIAPSATHAPSSSASVIYHKTWDTNFATQIATNHGGRMLTRTKTSGSWTSWSEVLSTSASSGGAKIAAGTYAGTGESGPDNPNVVNVGFVPKLFIVVGGRSSTGYKAYYFMTPGMVFGSYASSNTNSGEFGLQPGIVPTFGIAMQWYYDTDSPSSNTNSLQGNGSGYGYEWIAFG